jgi:hypothetical protein
MYDSGDSRDFKNRICAEKPWYSPYIKPAKDDETVMRTVFLLLHGGTFASLP